MERILLIVDSVNSSVKSYSFSLMIQTLDTISNHHRWGWVPWLMFIGTIAKSSESGLNSLDSVTGPIPMAQSVSIFFYCWEQSLVSLIHNSYLPLQLPEEGEFWDYDPRLGLSLNTQLDGKWCMGILLSIFLWYNHCKSFLCKKGRDFYWTEALKNY